MTGDLLDDHDALGLAALVRDREITATELVEAAITPDRGAQPHGERRGRDAVRARPRRGAPARVGAVRGRAVPGEGARRRRRRDGHDARLAPVRRRRGDRRQRRGRAFPRRGPDRARLHEHPRAREERHHRARPPRPDAEPVGARSLRRRLERRLGGRGRVGHGAGRRTATTAAARSASRLRRAACSGSSRRGARVPNVPSADSFAYAFALPARAHAHRARQRRAARRGRRPGARRPVRGAGAGAPVPPRGGRRSGATPHRMDHDERAWPRRRPGMRRGRRTSRTPVRRARSRGGAGDASRTTARRLRPRSRW